MKSTRENGKRTKFSLKFCKINLLLALFILCTPTYLPAQDQRIADSLQKEYLQNDFKDDSSRFLLLEEMCYNELRDLNKAVGYAQEMKLIAEKTNSKKYLRRAWYSRGTKERLRSNMEAALNAFIKSAQIAKELKSLSAEGDSYLAIADMYSDAGNHNTSTKYYNMAIPVLRKSADTTSLATALLNLGDEMRRTKKYDSAAFYTIQAKKCLKAWITLLVKLMAWVIWG